MRAFPQPGPLALLSAMISATDRIPTDSPLDLPRLLATRRPGHCLPRPFYTDPRLFALDLERVIRRGWLFAGHVSQLPETGSYLTFTLGQESLLIIRHDAKTLHALHNVCRHRGSLLCTE